MTVVSSRDFFANPKYYFDKANKESVVVKRGKKTYRIIQFENLSPSNDPYWADPRNVEALHEYDRLKAEGKIKLTRLTPEKEKEWFGDL